MKVDDYGRVIYSTDDLVSLLYEGHELTNEMFAEPSDLIDQYNALCKVNDKLSCTVPVALPKSESPEQHHMERQDVWFMPSTYAKMDVWTVLVERCTDKAQRDRLALERVEYESRGLNPLLRLMMYLVDEFRTKKIVWGVGRGSSVASFTLYLIGITKINPMKYGLEISEFLKD